MALPGLSVGANLVSTGLSIVGNFMKSGELKKQLEAQKRLLALANEATIAKREQQLYDNKRREKIMSGQALARSGYAGVASSSASVINAVADISAQSEVDKMRIKFNADLELRENAIRVGELSRQSRVAGREAFIQSAGDLFAFGAKGLDKGWFGG